MVSKSIVPRLDPDPQRVGEDDVLGTALGDPLGTDVASCDGTADGFLLGLSEGRPLEAVLGNPVGLNDG